MRLVITIPHFPDNAGLAALLVDGQVVTDLAAVAASLAGEGNIDLRPGMYGWINGSPDEGVRLHWAVKGDPADPEL